MEDTFLKTIASFGIDITPASASLKALAGDIERLEKLLGQTKLTLASFGNISMPSVAQQLIGTKVIYDQYGRTLSLVATNSKALEKANVNVATAARNHAKTVKDLNKEYNVLGSQFERRASWFFAGGMMFGGITAMKEAVNTITEVEYGVTQIARVMEDATFVFKNYRDELLKLGVQYGQTFATVQDIALRFAQAGYGVKDSLELTETALMALRSAELDAKNATESMIGIMAQWGLQAKDMAWLLDVLNQTADNYTVTTQDLVDGLLRSSGAAKIMGLSIQETIALLTVMREASGRTGREVGNALNSILSYIQRPKSINVLESLGIAVFADEARTQFRNVMDIFEDIAARWNTLSPAIQEGFVQAADDAELFNEELATALGLQEQWNDLQQRDISQAAAGVYRRNYFIAMIERLANAQKVLNNMVDAEGYSARETARSLETLAGQYDQLKASAEQLAVAIGDTGLLNDLKEVVEGAKDAVTWFNELDPALQRLIITFAELTAGVKILGAILKMGGIIGAGGLFAGATQVKNLSTALSALGTAAANAGKGLLAFLGGWPGLAALTATTGIVALIKHLREQETQVEQNRDALIKLGEEYNNLNTQLANTQKDTEEYKTLNEKLQATMNAIADIMPQVVAQWDSYGNAIAINNDLLRENIALANEAIRATYSQRLTEISRRYTELQNLIKEESQIQQDLSELLPEIEPGQYFIRRQPDLEKIRAYRQELNQLAQEMNTVIDFLAKGASDVGGISQLRTRKTTSTATTKGYVGTGAGTDAKRERDIIKEQIQALTDAIDQLELANMQLEASLSRTAETLNINSAEYDYLTQKIEAGIATNEEYVRAQGLLSDKISLLKQQQQQLQQANEDYRQDINALNPVLEKARSLYEAFVKAGDVEHMRDAQQAVSQLQSKIESLNNAISQNTVQWWQNQQAIQEAMRAMSEDYYRRLSEWMDHMASTGRLTTQQQIEYLKALDKTRLSLQIQREVEQKLYNLRREALQEQMDDIREAYDERMRQIEEEIEAEEEATQRKIEQKEKRIEAIDEETNAQIEALQRLIDALDVEDTQSNREEAERQHNKKLAELQEEYQYHALRTGLEHQRRMAEILEEMAEEEHAWELQKQEWARQDQRDAYQQQIDALREQAKVRQDAIREEIRELQKSSQDKKKELQKYYDDLQQMMDESSTNMLASLSLYGDRYVNEVEDILQRIKRAIESNKVTLLPGLYEELEETLGEAERETEKRKKETIETTEPEPKPKAIFTPMDYINRNNRAYAQARLIGERLGLPVEWDEKNWIVKIGSKGFTPDFIENDRAYLGLRRIGEAFGYEVDYLNDIVRFLPKAHTGAYVAESGIAELLKGERVLSPQLTVSFDRLANVLSTFPNIPDKIAVTSNIDRLADRIIAALERRGGVKIDRLLHIEHFEPQDKTDLEILSREMLYNVNQLRTAKG